MSYRVEGKVAASVIELDYVLANMIETMAEFALNPEEGCSPELFESLLEVEDFSQRIAHLTKSVIKSAYDAAPTH